MAHEPLGSIRARCITFARMGMIAFSYDMVGYNDSLQVPRHRFASPRGSLWGLAHGAANLEQHARRGFLAELGRRGS